MYWFGDDRVGRRFRDALVERALAGVRVRVLFDTIDSLETRDSFWRPLILAWAEVQAFPPISSFKRRFRLARIANRDSISSATSSSIRSSLGQSRVIHSSATCAGHVARRRTRLRQ